ncbi:MAG: glycosyl hydrolase family 65 protein [Sedimentisphaerales bacterium]
MVNISRRNFLKSVGPAITPVMVQGTPLAYQLCQSHGSAGCAALPCFLAKARTGVIDQFESILKPDSFKHYVHYFNTMEDENIVNLISNAQSWLWMKSNIPLFECPDKAFEEIYYYRWWTYRKHIKQTPDGLVLTEFILPVKHAGKYNTISCPLGHHIREGRWLHNQKYLKDYVTFWFRMNDGAPQKHLHQYSGWYVDSLYHRYLVHQDKEFLVELLPDIVCDYEKWEKEKLLDNGLFWQHDVRDGMEESISGSRRAKNIRPTINSYMYANAGAISKIAEMAGKTDLSMEYADKAAKLKSLFQKMLWDDKSKFFKVRLENGELSDAREAIGFIPWYFNLPDPGYEQAWAQLVDPEGFWAPYGITTAERRHPMFRSHGVGTCEWDGAVWPFATSQTLVAMANLLNDYEQSYVTKDDYFNALKTYAKSQHKTGKPYIGEYLDEKTGCWLKGNSERSRYYNHSTFCDLVITGLAGLRPRDDKIIEVSPLLPSDGWDWFCLDRIPYHGQTITILWDKTGDKYGQGSGLRIYANNKEVVSSDTCERVIGHLP